MSKQPSPAASEMARRAAKKPRQIATEIVDAHLDRRWAGDTQNDMLVSDIAYAISCERNAIASIPASPKSETRSALSQSGGGKDLAAVREEQ